MLRPKIRLANDTEGHIICNILGRADEHVPDDLDWSRVWPHWLIASYKGVDCGVINVLPGRPLGYIGSLAVLPSHQRQGIAAYLCWAAEGMLASSGVSGSAFVTKHPHINKALQRHGA